ncbi:hypothetical protein EVAR_77538_1 [Eumeta japonica]|uniref:Uncharacterized protein n=1 Tax=Eumeta variegata TaxID=151549 RepID=A0A4C1T6H8_EUMVA|nr:hypothetical protein EVAR_77538_1 [Eumeta japonica]
MLGYFHYHDIVFRRCGCGRDKWSDVFQSVREFPTTGALIASPADDAAEPGPKTAAGTRRRDRKRDCHRRSISGPRPAAPRPARSPIALFSRPLRKTSNRPLLNRRT